MFGIPEVSVPRVHEGGFLRPESSTPKPDSVATRDSGASLSQAQIRDGGMPPALGARSGGTPLAHRLNVGRIIAPYTNYLQNNGNLKDRPPLSVVQGLVSRLAKPALDQQLNNPQQYVSHGFDHSERVAAYTDQIVKAYPEIAEKAAGKYNISAALARLMFQVLAHWHDVGYPDLKGRPKATHGLSGASKFDSVSDELGTLIRRENGRVKEALADMKKAIQLHSADVAAGLYPINVKTERGSLLVPDVESLKKLLNHYSAASNPPHRVSQIEVRGDYAKELERQVNDALKTLSIGQTINVTADETKPAYMGRPTSLDKGNEVKVGLRYTDQELTRNPFAIIRFADNLDMASDRLSPLQRSPAFRAMYWTLGDRGPIGRTLAELSKLDGKNTADVPAIARNLQRARIARGSTDVDSAILANVAQRYTPGAIRGLDASAARRLLTKATVDSVLGSPLADGLSESEHASLRDVGYRLNGESIRHFGGCEAIEDVKVARGKVWVTVDEPLYQRLNEVKDPDGVGIGEYQIERARQAFSSLTINGKRLVVEVIGRNST
ncbi:hypothetical protein [Paraburkholderia sp. 2C]